MAVSSSSSSSSSPHAMAEQRGREQKDELLSTGMIMLYPQGMASGWSVEPAMAWPAVVPIFPPAMPIILQANKCGDTILGRLGDLRASPCRSSLGSSRADRPCSESGSRTRMAFIHKSSPVRAV
jgi:hypothetical protein